MSIAEIRQRIEEEACPIQEPNICICPYCTVSREKLKLLDEIEGEMKKELNKKTIPVLTTDYITELKQKLLGVDTHSQERKREAQT